MGQDKAGDGRERGEIRKMIDVKLVSRANAQKGSKGEMLCFKCKNDMFVYVTTDKNDNSIIFQCGHCGAIHQVYDEDVKTVEKVVH